MNILGIETSCDETAASVLRDGRKILSNVISSQAEFHSKYGGVVPEIASRQHQQNITAVLREALDASGCELSDVDGIAVTCGPGLVGSLLVGINFAKALAFAQKIPLVGINHLEGHLLAPLLEHDIDFPNITLVVSGGHTNLYCFDAVGRYRLLGKTRDDAAGEAFDKVAKLLNLGYPGGVIIDRMARQGDPDCISFPRPLMHDHSLDFSFSGLKTAVLYHVKSLAHETLTQKAVSDICASFQKAAVDILVGKTLRAAQQHQARSISIAGGVACNSLLRETMQAQAADKNMSVYSPAPVLCTDNAAMIALAGTYKIKDCKKFPYELNAVSRLTL